MLGARGVCMEGFVMQLGCVAERGVVEARGKFGGGESRGGFDGGYADEIIWQPTGKSNY